MAISTPGLRPQTNLQGWQFQPDPVETGRFYLIAPMTMHIQEGQLGFDSPDPLSVFPFLQAVQLQDQRLIITLPFDLLPMHEASLQTCDAFTECLVGKMDLIPSHVRAGGSDLRLVYELLADPITIPAGQVLAQITIIGSEASGQNYTEPEPATETTYNPHVIPQKEEFWLKVWRMHPNGARITPASKDLMGDAPHGAVKWCGPFTHANAYGFYLFSPVDMDVVWQGGRNFVHHMHKPYTDDEYGPVSQMAQPGDHYQYAPRAKVEFGRVHDGIVGIWTGCIFQTPPGWTLMIRSPVNVTSSGIYRISEGILETDWMAYDIWMNVQFLQPHQWVQFRKDSPWPPIAHLLPVRRDAYEANWPIEERPFERSTPEGKALYQRWHDYNYEKWLAQGRKDSSTYHRERVKGLQWLENQ